MSDADRNKGIRICFDGIQIMLILLTFYCALCSVASFGAFERVRTSKTTLFSIFISSPQVLHRSGLDPGPRWASWEMFWRMWGHPVVLPASWVTFNRQKCKDFVEKNLWMIDFFLFSRQKCEDFVKEKKNWWMRDFFLFSRRNAKTL